MDEQLIKNRPDLTREKVERTREKMDMHVRDCLVTGYEDLIDGLRLPDPKDRHVLAAAIRANARTIVTDTQIALGSSCCPSPSDLPRNGVAIS